jgi:ribosomal protein L1
MPEEKKQPIFQEVIALPPLKMVLVFAKEERMNKAKAASVIENDEFKSAIQEEHVETQDLKKIIEHLEKKSKTK